MNTFPSSTALERLPDQFFARLVNKAQALVQAGHDVINLGQGNPDLPTPHYIVEALQKAAANPDYHKYSPFRGHSKLKEAVASYYWREYGVELDAEHEIAILPGSKTGLVELSQCLLNPGDLALLPDPGYPDYMSGIALAHARTVMMPLLEENNFLPNYNVLTTEQLHEAKLMFLNYPNNPTAATASPAFFEQTVSLAKTHNICVCHDFAYATIGFDGEKPRSFLQTEGAKDIGIEMFTLSKAYNMAGWRVGFAIGNRSVIKQINLIQDHLYVSLFGAIQDAASTALLGPQDETIALTKTYETRRNKFVAALEEAGWQVKAPSGTFFCWLKIPDHFTSQTFADYLLEHAHVVVAPGNGFGECGEGYVRTGLVTPSDRLVEAAVRIKNLNLFHSTFAH
ncbi:aminotransferase [Amphibacillus marinus]|uniref:Aminotransferase n=1 Tax=Amphibacillus marinus TaxID=872970 RepID=A0A1H8M9T9_9BACI|nr:pyridoxal phosphate-dependent aminotransferase [Amphibacillus marinus]SEO14030.1 aminotransferase [Amphibacillus marinus]